MKKPYITPGAVKLRVDYQQGQWRFRYKDPDTGKRKEVRRASFEDAKREANKKAREIAGEQKALTPEENQLFREIRRLAPTTDDLEAFRDFLRERVEFRKPVEECARRFLSEYEEGVYLKTLTTHLKPFRELFGERNIDTIGAPEIKAFIERLGGENRSKLNRRRVLVTFFRWAQGEGFLSPHKLTAPETTKAPRVRRKSPETYSPEEFQTLLEAANPEMRPMIAAAGFLGIRTEEITKLTWAMYRPGGQYFDLPPEITKTNERRIIPVPDAFLAWAPPGKGAVCPFTPFWYRRNPKKESESSRLGKLVGGWKKNGLRHSFCSYRSALIGVGQTALEAGNSETVIKRNYKDAKTEEEARSWFSILPASNLKIA